MSDEENPEEPTPRRQPGLQTHDPDFPELTRLRELDREDHVRRAREMGLSEGEAEAHARHDMRRRDRDDARQ